MKIAVICTGDELLKGAVLNTNLKFIGEQLLANGMIPVLSLEVRDGMEAISDALESAFSKADTVIVSGGLGPTCDDMTKEAAAKFFQLPLVQDDRTHLKLMKEKIPCNRWGNRVYSMQRWGIVGVVPLFVGRNPTVYPKTTEMTSL